MADNLEVHEEFLGLYHVDSIDAATVTMTITDLFQHFGLSIGRLRAQCYDGASAMSGSRSGVAKRIRDLEPKAFFVHCYGHALNLSACGTLKQCKPLRNALETTHEITKLIKYSPRREAIFQKIKDSLPVESSGTGAGIRVLCPTHWTVRAVSLKSILDNFSVLQETWEKAVEVVKDSETKARIRGIAVQMSTFDYFYGNLLGQLVLKHVDNLSSTLQHKTMSAAEGQTLARMTVETLESIRNDASFDLFWQSTKKKAESLDIEEPRLPRQRKTPKRFDDGTSAGEFHSSPVSFYKQIYYEVLDMMINCIKQRFSQPGYQSFQSMETLLIKACMQENFDSELSDVCQTYQGDLDEDLLQAQLLTLGVSYSQSEQEDSGNMSVFNIREYLQNQSTAQLSLLSQVKHLMQLLLVMPATNASSERSFSALRRVKTYLRATMTQERLNHMMVLHVHKDSTDSLDLKKAVNEFISCSEHRTGIFAKF